jgi:hypothetical protein
MNDFGRHWGVNRKCQTGSNVCIVSGISNPCLVIDGDPVESELWRELTRVEIEEAAIGIHVGA